MKTEMETRGQERGEGEEGREKMRQAQDAEWSWSHSWTVPEWNSESLRARTAAEHIRTEI